MKKKYDNVIPFKIPESASSIEHVDSTTIVEKAITDKQRALFRKAYAEALFRAYNGVDKDYNPGVPS